MGSGLARTARRAPRVYGRRRAATMQPAMSATLVLVILVALLCIDLLALFGMLWAALHFGVGDDDDQRTSLAPGNE
jgi:hypothetical protein